MLSLPMQQVQCISVEIREEMVKWNFQSNITNRTTALIRCFSTVKLTLIYITHYGATHIWEALAPHFGVIHNWGSLAPHYDAIHNLEVLSSHYAAMRKWEPLASHYGAMSNWRVFTSNYNATHTQGVLASHYGAFHNQKVLVCLFVYPSSSSGWRYGMNGNSDSCRQPNWN